MCLRCAHFQQFPCYVKLEGLELILGGHLQHYQHKAGIWFYEAKKHDTEKMMIIKNSGRAIHTDIGSSGFRYIKQHLDELKQFAEYKGFKE